MRSRLVHETSWRAPTASLCLAILFLAACGADRDETPAWIAGDPPTVAAEPTLPAEEIPPTLASTPDEDAGWVSVSFVEKAGYISNPLMGWQDTEPLSPRFPETVAYQRYNWNRLELAPGVYDWSPIESLRAEAAIQGAQISWRVRTVRPPPFGTGQVLPDWLIGDGVHIYDDGEHATEPVYGDCRFLESHGLFVDAMRRQYDGDPGVAFLDVGSYGYFGEWDSAQYNEETDSLDWHARRRIVDMYLGGSANRPCLEADGALKYESYDYAGFQQTRLVMGYTPWQEDSLVYALGRRKDVGIRQDSLGSETHQAYIRERAQNLFQETWPHAPIVFELAPEAYTSEALASARDFAREMHATFVHDNLDGRGDDSDLLALLEVIGYRLEMNAARYTPEVREGDRLGLELRWENSGVAPPYSSFPVFVVLTDRTGSITWTVDLGIDITSWLPGKPLVYREKLELPGDLEPGRYDLSVAIVDPRSRLPVVRLASERQDDQGYLPLGPLELLP
jgi:hypothetical protein